ncbi:hypothetical protein SBDP1_840008 [Syntrophobacter sp. SbD1]|nr:hypothetical protein SBDP1_840008 [Syntrophobacter sp. SbD1]
MQRMIDELRFVIISRADAGITQLLLAIRGCNPCLATRAFGELPGWDPVRGRPVI